ncbi:MAG: hypothetical protein ACOH5I_17850 [Oligoflexus sp.]
MRHTFICTQACLLLSACFPGPGFFEQSEMAADTVAEVKTVDDGETTIGMISASSNVTQRIKTADNSDLSGVELSISPGTLQVDMAISLEESLTLTSGKAAAQMGVSFGAEAGKAVNLRNDRGILEIPAQASPMVLQLPVNSSGLKLNSSDVLVTFMRQDLGQGDCFEQIFPPDSFAIQDNKIKIGVRRFGAYQPIYMPEADLTKIKAEAVNGVYSIMRPGCRIETKKEQKSLPAVSISMSTFTETNRVLTLQATVEGEDVDICYLYGRDSLSGKEYTQEAEQPSFKVDFTSSTEAIDSRFMIGCDLISGRNVETSFRRLELAAPSYSLKISYDNRSIIVSANIPASQVESCQYFIESRIGKDLNGTVNDLTKHVIDLSAVGEIDADLYFTCKTSNGTSLQTAKKSIYLPPFATSDPPPIDEETTNPPPSQYPYEPLTLMNVDISSTNVIAGNYLSVTLQADSPYEINHFCIQLMSMNYSYVHLDCSGVTSDGSGFYTGNFLVPIYFQNITYSLSELQINDQWGYFHHYNGHYLDPYYMDTTVAIPQFTVSGATPDTTAPVISAINFQQTSINVGQYLYITAEATDDIAGIDDRFSMCIDLATSDHMHYFHECGHWYSIGGNQYQMEIYLPTWMANGDYFLNYVNMNDRAGNWVGLYTSTYGTTYDNSTIEVPVVTITGGTADTTPPSLNSISFQQTTYYPGDWAAVLINASDDNSGLQLMDSYCWGIDTLNATDYFYVCPKYHFIDAQTIEAVFQVPSGMPADTYYLKDFRLMDQANNYQYFFSNEANPPYYDFAPSVLVPSFQLMAP